MSAQSYRFTRYSPKRKYVWAAVGALVGLFYSTILLFFPIISLPTRRTLYAISEITGFGNACVPIDEKDYRLNILLWAGTVGGTVYCLKRRKEKVLNGVRSDADVTEGGTP